MRKYTVVRPGAICLAAVCLAMCTGLAVEKVLKDGVSSFTLLAAMVVLPAAVGMLLHQCFEDIRDWKLLRAPTAMALAALCLSVTLPASIGSSGGARDAALAEAKASNRALQIAESSFDEAQRDLNTAKAGIARECVGAPAVITDDSWPKCRWFRRAAEAYQSTLDRFGKVLISAPVEKVADSGEQRVAWALSAIASNWGYSVKASDVALVWPILPPIAFELLAAFFLCIGLQRRVSPGSLAAENQPVTAIEAPQQTELPRVEVFAESVNNPPSDPRPRKRTTPRQKRRDRVVAAIRKQTLAGQKPSFKLVKARYRLANATASRYMKEAAA